LTPDHRGIYNRYGCLTSGLSYLPAMKKIWLIFQSVLLALTVVFWFGGAEDLFGICLTILIVLSFPINLLVGWLFFAFDLLSAPAMLLVMAFVMSVLGYIQWFELVPRIARLFSSKLSSHDRQIRISVDREQPAQLEEAKRTDTDDWLNTSNDKEKYSPVERVFSQE
jgi:hypothetical protein